MDERRRASIRFSIMRRSAGNAIRSATRTVKSTDRPPGRNKKTSALWIQRSKAPDIPLSALGRRPIARFPLIAPGKIVAQKTSSL